MWLPEMLLLSLVSQSINETFLKYCNGSESEVIWNDLFSFLLTIRIYYFIKLEHNIIFTNVWVFKGSELINVSLLKMRSLPSNSFTISSISSGLGTVFEPSLFSDFFFFIFLSKILSSMVWLIATVLNPTSTYYIVVIINSFISMIINFVL